MGKSVEELKRILERMQKDLERPAGTPRPSEAAATERPVAVKRPEFPEDIPGGVEEQREGNRRDIPSIQPSLPAGRQVPRTGKEGVEGSGRNRAPLNNGRNSVPDAAASELPSGRSRPANVRRLRQSVEEDEAFDQTVLWAVWKSPRALLWGATVVAIVGVVLKNMWVVAAGYLGLLAYSLFWGGRDDGVGVDDFDELSRRVAILEKRLSGRSASGGGEGVSQQTAEEIEELRVMVRSMYRVLQGSSTAQGGVARREHGEDEE